MKSLGALAFVMLLGSVSVAAAAPIPEFMLNKDYEKCMGGDQDPQRAEYCNCVRDTMKSWDLDTYGNIVLEQSKSGSTTESVSSKIDEVARSCIMKVLR